MRQFCHQYWGYNQQFDQHMNIFFEKPFLTFYENRGTLQVADLQ